jgi:putative tryptophan/tyrosine transport system substrate-binding protein
MTGIGRREFIAGVGGVAAMLPFAARAQQQPDRVRRIGVLTLGTEDDPNNRRFAAVLRESLEKAGWIEGRNLRIDLRHAANDPNRLQSDAKQLAGLGLDVIVGFSAAATRALQHETQTIPIVFVYVGDPVNQAIVKSLARPEGNTTGFTNLFASIAGKCVQLLRDAVPSVVRLGLIFNPEIYIFEDYLAEIENSALAAAVNATRTPVRNATEIERAIDAFAAEPNGALFIVPPPLTVPNRQLLHRLAVKHKLPSIYPGSNFTDEGGLMAYTPDIDDVIRGASSYVDRILRGAKVSELPVQFPTKFTLVVNLKTAKAMGLTIPESFLLRADEVIQ